MKIPVTIRELVVSYAGAPAVAGVSLDVEPGELFLLLGPSGCGKTTLLRAIAGFAPVQAGSIRFGDEEVTHLPAHRRHAGMVFQSFALWPHMTVAENVAFGLREQGVSRAEIKGRVAEALRSTQIPDYGARAIDELSGGEQQRVALARALVVRPRCLLLDEPLSNLDAKLRRSMREEIRRICKSFGLTTIYVTHDQKEALAVADRIAVMRAGRILQVGRPDELYRRPRSCTVASFIGETNLVKGRVSAVTPDAVTVTSVLGTLMAAPGEAIAPIAGQEVWISIRPECLRRVGEGAQAGASPVNVIMGELAGSVFLGELAERHLTVGEARLSMYELNPPMGAQTASPSEEGGERVLVAVIPQDVQLLPVEEPPPSGKMAQEPEGNGARGDARARP